MLEFCLLLIDSPCVEVMPDYVRFFGVSELAASIAFLAIPWSLMSRSDKLRFKMSPLGIYPKASFASAVLLSLITIAMDFISSTLIADNDFRQFYFQQAQLGIVLLLIFVFFSIIKYCFFHKPPMTSRNAEILAEEMRRIENSQGSYEGISEVIIESIPDLISSVEILKNPNHGVKSIIQTISNDYFLNYTAENNPIIAELIAKQIEQSNCDPAIFDKFFSKFLMRVIERNQPLITGFLRSDLLGDDIKSPLTSIFRSKKILEGCPGLFSTMPHADTNQSRLVSMLILSTHRFCLCKKVYVCESISNGLFLLGNELQLGLINYSSSLHAEIRETNLIVSKMHASKELDLTKANSNDIVSAWVVILDGLVLGFANKFDGSLKGFGTDLAEILSFGVEKNTIGNLIATTAIRRSKLASLYNASLNKDKLFKFFDALLLGRSSRLIKKKTALNLMARYWRMHSPTFKNSIHH